MGGYLERYGVGDERREKTIKWIVIAAIVAVIVCIVGYFVFRTWPARRHTEAFLDALRKSDYQTAYRMFGCEQPCKDYPFNSFMEDWGPKSEFSNPSNAAIKKTRFCNTGVIVTLHSPKGNDVALWYERRSAALGFSPWPVCVEHIAAPVSPPAK